MCCSASLATASWMCARRFELDATGKVKGCINVPFMNAKYRFDTEKREKVLEKTEIPEEEFIAAVEKRIPDKSTPILVCCSDGTAYSMDALGALDDAGYETLVGLKGGFYAWYRVWDANLRSVAETATRRRTSTTVTRAESTRPELVSRRWPTRSRPGCLPSSNDDDDPSFVVSSFLL